MKIERFAMRKSRFGLMPAAALSVVPLLIIRYSQYLIV
jgi:hypothetical protein